MGGGETKKGRQERSSKMDFSSVFHSIELIIGLKCKTVAPRMSCLGYQPLPSQCINIARCIARRIYFVASFASLAGFA